MSIPPHRAAGDLGHIEDHNAMVDVLTGNDADIAAVTEDLAEHIAGEDPHGDRAWASEQFAPIDHTHTFPVTSVNGETGNVTLSASDVGAATPAMVSDAISDIEEYADATFINLEEKGSNDGVVPLNSDGLIDLEYLPGFGGASRVTVDDEPPSSPNIGDVWINTSETLPEPSPIMPETYRTYYDGPDYYPHATLHAAREFGPFPGDDWPAITFTTGPTGYTKISTKVGIVNSATNQSTSAVTYSLTGDDVDEEATLGHGAYQWPRAIQSSAHTRLDTRDEWDLPPDTEVTLVPQYRLSSNPSAAAQNGDDDSIKFGISLTMQGVIRVECW